MVLFSAHRTCRSSALWAHESSILPYLWNYYYGWISLWAHCSSIRVMLSFSWRTAQAWGQVALLAHFLLVEFWKSISPLSFYLSSVSVSQSKHWYSILKNLVCAMEIYTIRWGILHRIFPHNPISVVGFLDVWLDLWVTKLISAAKVVYFFLEKFWLFVSFR